VIDAVTFRSDVLASGAINATDIGVVKAASGTQLPVAPADKTTAR
jgi:hypothetical protein